MDHPNLNWTAKYSNYPYTEGDICNIYSPKYIKVIELMTNNSLEKRILGSDYLFIEFIKYLRMNNTVLVSFQISMVSLKCDRIWLYT